MVASDFFFTFISIMWDKAIKSIMMHYLGQFLFDFNFTAWKNCFRTSLHEKSVSVLRKLIGTFLDYFMFQAVFSTEILSFNKFPQCWNLGCPWIQMVSAMETYWTLKFLPGFRSTYTVWISIVYQSFPQWKHDKTCSFCIVSIYIYQLDICFLMVSAIET